MLFKIMVVVNTKYIRVDNHKILHIRRIFTVFLRYFSFWFNEIKIIVLFNTYVIVFNLVPTVQY